MCQACAEMLILTYLICNKNLMGRGTVIVPISQMKKLRLRETQSLVQGHADSKRQGQHVGPECGDKGLVLLIAKFL